MGNELRRLILVLAAAGCTAATPTSAPATPNVPDSIPRGGVLRVVIPQGEPFTSALAAPEPQSGELDLRQSVLDPHADVWYDGAELLRCCLARTLLATNGMTAEQGGAVLHPDLAAALPEVSGDGLAWTFRIKPDVRYGPPVGDVEVTARDFVRSFERMLLPVGPFAIGPEFFSDIVGAEAYVAGEAASISGLETPDEHTLVIRLVRPAGDLAARLTTPMTAPLPPNPADPAARFGTADGHLTQLAEDDDGPAPGTYGQFLVSSGPYMLAGSEALDFSRPAVEQTPAAGVVPGESITLVRNPNWDPATDGLRPARPDRIEVFVAPSLENAVAELDAGRADLLVNATQAPTVPPDIVAEFEANPARGSVHINEFDAIRGLELNVAQPPFDDVHVRRAVNLVLDKATIIDLHGGPYAFRVAEHAAPNAVLNNLLVDYAPYATEGGGGDVEAARAAMAISAYDSDGDGVCDADACRAVRAVTREPYHEIAEVARRDLTEIGIELAVETLAFEDFFAAYGDPRQHVAIYAPLGWAKSRPAAAEFFARYYFPGPGGLGDGSLVGSTPEQLAEWGYDIGEVPSVDERFEACIPLVGNDQFECWAAVDQHIMENVVPLVAYGSELFVVLASPRVAHYAFDQSIGAPAFDQIGLAP